jgi:hypothetical protein
MNPNLRKLLFTLAIGGLAWVAWSTAGWQGLALFGGGALMWLLLHFNRTMQVLRRAAERPIGYVDSAVMLNAKLRAGVNLMHIMAMTRSMGEPLSPKDAEPELYRWTDNSQSHVTCELRNGRLVSWKLERPATDEGADGATAPGAAGEVRPAVAAQEQSSR